MTAGCLAIATAGCLAIATAGFLAIATAGLLGIAATKVLFAAAPASRALLVTVPLDCALEVASIEKCIRVENPSILLDPEFLKVGSTAWVPSINLSKNRYVTL